MKKLSLTLVVCAVIVGTTPKKANAFGMLEGALIGAAIGAVVGLIIHLSKPKDEQQAPEKKEESGEWGDEQSFLSPESGLVTVG